MSKDCLTLDRLQKTPWNGSRKSCRNRPVPSSSVSTTITTVNVNGIRAAVKQRSEVNPGMLAWLTQTDSDIVLMQEVRASEKQAREALQPALDAGWHLAMSESVVKGHAGVGVLSRTEPQDVRVGFGSDEFDATGRYLEADFDAEFGPLTVASLYLPRGRPHPPTPPPTRRPRSSRRRNVSSTGSVRT